MTLQTLEYFIAVAQYKNFTRAAQACHVTQPALSRAIRGLEEELGCPLLIRAGRTATLTPEGEVCLTEAKRVLQQREELKLRVWERMGKKQPPLRVGYLSVSSLNDFLQWLDRGEESTRQEVEAVSGTMTETKRRLRSGEVDAIILPKPCMADLTDVRWLDITESALYALVHRNNILYTREELTFADLVDQPLVVWSEKELPLLRAAHIQAFHDVGLTPRIAAEGVSLGDLLAQMMLHNGVVLANRVTSTVGLADCRFIPITDSTEQYGTVCVWRTGDYSPQLAMLKRTLTADKK